MITYDFFRDRKFEEVRAFELLPRHPNILRFIQAWEEKQHLFIQVSHFWFLVLIVSYFLD